jgi:hypothetical protein
LRGNKTEHERILLHEIFHFVWVRLGNPRRREWEALLAREWKARARGEAGWSAEWRKRALRSDDVAQRTLAWREYCCESFCDTGAWVGGGHEREVTLAARRRETRRSWFTERFATGCLAI